MTLPEYTGGREPLPITDFKIVRGEKVAVNFSNLYIHFFDLVYLNSSDDEDLRDKGWSIEKFAILNDH